MLRLRSLRLELDDEEVRSNSDVLTVRLEELHWGSSFLCVCACYSRSSLSPGVDPGCQMTLVQNVRVITRLRLLLLLYRPSIF